MIYRRGQRFKLRESEEVFILAQVGNSSDDDLMVLINLKSGNRWHDPVLVKSSVCITYAEFKEIVGVRVKEFILDRMN